jgi:hypothetical protein
MDQDMAERLRGAASTLQEIIELLQAYELRETAQFLTMARVNLLMDIHGISDHELRELCGALEAGGDFDMQFGDQVPSEPERVPVASRDENAGDQGRRHSRIEEIRLMAALRTRVKQ